MSIVTGTFLFGLPEDKDSDKVKIWESTTEGGTYTQAVMVDYTYAARAVEYVSLNTEKWYKIQLTNTATSVDSPISDAVYGGDYDNSKPFVAITTSFDGAGYATTTDLYESSNLTASDASLSDVRNSLRTANAFVDMVLGDTNLHRYSRVHSTDVARRKYNAQLEIIKKVEIDFALALLFKDMADDALMTMVRDQRKLYDNISIGQTSIAVDEAGTQLSIAEFLNTQSTRYNTQATALLASILPTSVSLIYNGEVQAKMTDLYTFSGTMSGDSGDSLTFLTEDLTGSGGSMNDVWLDLSATLLTTAGIIEDSYILVNGVQYSIDSWIDTLGVTHGSGTSGFSLDVQTSTHKIRWNYTTANSGFDLTNPDEVFLKYWN